MSPLELEELLVQHPLVDEAAVCGIWSQAHTSDLVRAYVVPKDMQIVKNDPHAAANSLSQYVSDRVSNYKRLKGGIVFVNQLPKNPTGKVLRRVLRSNAENGAVEGVLAKL